MMKRRRLQSGFTAVELLITLFVAAAFIVAGYQLFNVVIKDGGDVRAQSTAANVAYTYLRKYSDAATNPCSSQAPLTDESISVDGLTDVVVTVTIQCAQTDAPSLSRVDATIAYNKDTPKKSLTYSTYVDKSAGATGSSDITDNLVAWWRLNGNANSEVGGFDGTVVGATSTTNRDGQLHMAYGFTGAANAQHIRVNTGPSIGITNVTLTAWVYNPTASNSGAFIKLGGGSSTGYGIGIGSTVFDNNAPGTKIVALFENIRWIATTTDLGTGWHMVALVINASGVPSIYKDGVLVGTYAGTNAIAPNTGQGIYIGGMPGRYFNGSVDDTRVYSRALSGSEVLQLYNGGPK